MNKIIAKAGAIIAIASVVYYLVKNTLIPIVIACRDICNGVSAAVKTTYNTCKKIWDSA